MATAAQRRGAHRDGLRGARRGRRPTTWWSRSGSTTAASLDAALAGVDARARRVRAAPGQRPQRGGAAADDRRPRSARAPDAIALVSVPGEHAFAEAMDAVEAGLSVMVFSYNVPVEQEVASGAAAEQGLLVMGPDCGTAVVGGPGLGFANVVRPGRVAIVAASGTGGQQVPACSTTPAPG